MDARTRPSGPDDTGELTRQHRGRRKAKPHRRRALHVAILVPLAIASTTWAAVSFNTPIREATHSWFPDGYNVAVAPGKSTQPEEQTTTEEDSDKTAGKQNIEDSTPETSDARNRVPVTTDPSPSADNESDTDSGPNSDSDRTDDPQPDQPDPEPTKTKDIPAPPTTAPTPPPNDPEPTPSDTPTSEPTEDPGDDGEEEEDGGIIDIDIELPLPLLGAPGPEASTTGANTLGVDTGVPGAVPGTGIKDPTISVSVADLLTWTYVVWQSIG